MLVANPLPETFASISIPITDIVDVPKLDPIPYSGPAKSDPEYIPGSHYINSSFSGEVSKVTDFVVTFSFKSNHRVIVPLPINTVVNPPLSCIAMYLEALEHGLRFPLPQIVMQSSKH